MNDIPDRFFLLYKTDHKDDDTSTLLKTAQGMDAFVLLYTGLVAMCFRSHNGFARAIPQCPSMILSRENWTSGGAIRCRASAIAGVLLTLSGVEGKLDGKPSFRYVPASNAP